MSVVGIELTASELRAVRLRAFGRGVAAECRVPWNPAQPDAAVAEARRLLGRADRIGVAIGVSLLELKRVSLPPVPLGERERMLQLEPDRYFAVTGDLVTALDDNSSTAFAVRRDDVMQWLTAIEAWAPIDRVEAAPLAVARVTADSGHFSLDDAEDTGIVELDHSRLRAVRRLAAHADRNGARPLPAIDGRASAFHAAYGVARGIDAAPVAQLAPTTVRSNMDRRQRRRFWTTAATTAAALVFAGWSYERWQERSLDALGREAGALTATASPALQSQAQLAVQRTELNLLRAHTQSSSHPLAVLAMLSRVLPSDVTVTSVRVQGDAWQVDGTARDASQLVPILDRDGGVADVRAVAATTRFADGGRVRESFSITFRAAHAP
ncbi:MAG: PilN domain-containing protein [Gemmatimonadaceae bacterium]